MSKRLIESNNDFRYDLKTGKLGEDKLRQLLSETTIEVKTDIQAINTGNIYVEYEAYGKPSGIALTEAKWWAFIIDGTDMILLIGAEELKNKARPYVDTTRDIVIGNGSTRGVLIPLKELMP